MWGRRSSGPYIRAQSASPLQVPCCALPGTDTAPPISHSLQQGDKHPLVAGWLGWVMTSLPNSCGTPHIARWVLGGIQESSSHGSSDAKGMLCKGCLCTQGQKGLQPPSCHAAWSGMTEGRCRLHASSPTCPQLRSRAGGKRTASTPRTAKGT